MIKCCFSRGDQPRLGDGDQRKIESRTGRAKPGTDAVDGGGIEILDIDVYNVPYKILREVLEDLLRHLTEATRDTVTKARYRKMIFEHAMPYVKEDLERMQTYAILDDVIRHLF